MAAEGVHPETARKVHGPFPSRDATRTMHLISPRRRGRWAESDRVRAERLMAEGPMHPAGAASAAAAKAAGTWAVDEDALAVPRDLAAALGPGRA